MGRSLSLQERGWFCYYLAPLPFREREGPAAKRWEGEGTHMRQVDGTEALARVRQLRRDKTPAEERIWSQLRDRRLERF